MKRLRPFLLLATLAVAATAATAALADGARHGLSVFGALKYPAGFAHFDYVDPAAPKGGDHRLSSIGSFDNLNPFILKGEVEDLALLPFDTLMVSAGDEPDAVYGLVAKTAELAADRRSMTFVLRPEARFHDGTPVTAEDVAFSFETIKAKGHPRFRLIYRDIERVTVLAPDRVRFDFAPTENRDLPIIAATLPVLSKRFFATNEFDRTTLAPVLGSGPYRVDHVEPGRSITYRRVADYWALELPVNVGRHNFDTIRVDYYRDRDVALEAFKAGAYDFREEFTAKNWATAYDFPALTQGLVVRRTLDDDRPSGTQAFFLNTRRSKFSDVRVREALGYAFDFEWLNASIFHGQYKRTRSVFENSELAARGLPAPEEVALLEPFRDALPPELFTRPVSLPTTDGSGNNRANLRAAQRLLEAAGWQIRNNVLVDKAGTAFEIELLTFEPSFERILAPFVRNLERLGIRARIRIVDSAQYQNRINEFDFDITTARFVMSLTPGVEQRNMWGSAAAEVPGSYNMSGIRNPVVDALIEKVVGATSRPALIAATRALDRVILWHHYLIPQWFKGEHNIAYWDKFGAPPIKPKYAPGYPDTWWFDAAKARALAARRAGGP